MRGRTPTPGTPWPHDMVIEVEDSPHSLLDLLWLREACALGSTGLDLPPLLVRTPFPAIAAPDAAVLRTWRAAWPIVWDEVLAHTAIPRQGELIGRITELPDGSAERAARIRAFIGPTWRDRFGDEVFDDEGYFAWTAEDAEERLRHGVGLERSPEHLALPVLVTAWEAGLVKVVTLPCRGRFTRVLGPSTLLVTAATRDDPDAYRAALAAFAADASLTR